MSERKLFYIHYGAGAAFSTSIVEAEGQAAAEIYAYQEAKDIFHDMVGAVGILSFEEFFDQGHYEDGDSNAIFEYDDYVEHTIYFKAEPYKVENEEHFSTFQMQSFIPVTI